MEDMKRMKKIISALLLAALCLSALTALAEGMVTTTASVNLRKGAGLDYEVIRAIQEGVTMSYDKTATDDRGVLWYRVSYRGWTGWVSSKYAREGGSGDAESRVTTTGNVNMRSGAGRDYSVIRVLSEGKVLTYDKTATDERGVLWYHVSCDGSTGWISSAYAKKTSGASSASPSSSGASGRVKTTASVNLRQGAGRDYSVIRALDKGTVLEYDRTAADERGVVWYRVSYKGRTGWVSSVYATKVKSESSGGSSSSDSKVKTTASVYMREYAGLDYEVICAISKGTTMTYDRTATDERGVVWYRVSYNGKRGWVSSKYARRK